MYFRQLVLGVTDNCNLSCNYCFQKHIHKNKKITLLQGKKAIDFYINHAKDKYGISFYGGEPLLNFEVIKKLIMYAQEKAKKEDIPCKFSITSNGVLLTDKISYLLNELVSENKLIIIISLDGDKSTHDSNRVFKNGKGTWDIVMNNIESLKTKKNIEFRVSMTINPANPHIYEDIMFLEKQGVKKISFGLVDNFLPKPYFKSVLKQYLKLSDYFISSLNNNYETNLWTFKSILFTLYNKKEEKGDFFKDKVMCSAFDGLIYADPYDRLYGCPVLAAGDFNSFGLIDKYDEDKHIFFNRIGPFLKNHNFKCKKCEINAYCVGYCVAHSLKFKGSITKINEEECNSRKMDYEIASYIYKKLKNNSFFHEIMKKTRQDLLI